MNEDMWIRNGNEDKWQWMYDICEMIIMKITMAMNNDNEIMKANEDH